MSATSTRIKFLLLELMIVSACCNIKQQPSDVFLGFFPCVPGSMNMTTQEDAQSCDLFVYPAVQLALDEVMAAANGIEQRRLGLDAVVTKNFNNSVDFSEVSCVNVIPES